MKNMARWTFDLDPQGIDIKCFLIKKSSLVCPIGYKKLFSARLLKNNAKYLCPH